MSRFVNSTVICLAVALATVAVAAPASAAPPWTVSAPSAPPPTTVSFLAQTVGPTPQIVLTDTTTSTALTCNGGRISGGGVTGTYASGTNLIHVVGSSFSTTGCGALGLPFNASGTGSWRFNALTFSPAAGGTTDGRLVNINITWSSGTSCVFTATGSVRARYINASPGGPYLRLFAPGSSLTISGVSGCFGAFNNSDAATLVVKYQLLPGPFYPIQIT